MQLLDELLVVGVVISVEQGLVPGRNYEVGDVHGAVVYQEVYNDEIRDVEFLKLVGLLNGGGVRFGGLLI